MRITLIDFETGAEMALLAERGEGDAMRLQAPVGWQGEELERATELEMGCAAGEASSMMPRDCATTPRAWGFRRVFFDRVQAW